MQLTLFMEGSNMKNLCRAVIVIVAMALTYMICSRILLLKSEDGIEQMQSLYLQEDQTVDALLLGSSHIYCDVNTGILWDEYGISAFDLGGAEQPYWNNYYFLKEALKTQTPKVIVLDVTIPGIRSVDYQPEVWSVTNLYGMNWNRNRIEATRVSVPKSSFNRLMVPMNTMHTRYKELTKDDFVDSNRSINYKGFDLRERIVAFNRPDMSNVTESVPMKEKEEEYFRKIIALAGENNIPLLLVSVPFPVYEEAQKVYNYEFEIAEAEQVPYIDFNKGNYYDEIGIDFEKDFADEFHLNVSGNEKFSRYLGEYLAREYNLPDHRGDAKYKSWDVDADLQRAEANCANLGNAKEADEYLGLLNNQNYVTFVTLGSGAEDSEFLNEHRDELRELGLTDEYCQSGMVLILSGGEVLYASAGSDQKSVVNLPKVNLLLKRVSESGDVTTEMIVESKTYELDCFRGMKVVVYDAELNRVISQEEFDL